MGYLSRTYPNRKQMQHMREMHVAVNRTGRVEPSKPFNIGYTASGFGVCTAGFKC